MAAVEMCPLVKSKGRSHSAAVRAMRGRRAVCAFVSSGLGDALRYCVPRVPGYVTDIIDSTRS